MISIRGSILSCVWVFDSVIANVCWVEGVIRFISDYQPSSLFFPSSILVKRNETGDIRQSAFVKAETRAGGSNHQFPPILIAQIVSTT